MRFQTLIGLVVGASLALLAAAPAQAVEIIRWAVWSGDPCCGIPDKEYKYLDANQACQTA